MPEYGPFGDLVKAPMNNLLRIPQPASTMMAFVISEGQSVGTSADHTHSNRWTSWSNVLADIAPDRHRTGGPNADHNSGSSNYLYADGHVESISAASIKTRIDAGTNIAQPPGT